MTTDGLLDFIVSIKYFHLQDRVAAAPDLFPYTFHFFKQIKRTMSSYQPPTERMLPDFNALVERKTKEMTRVKLLALYGKLPDVDIQAEA